MWSPTLRNRSSRLAAAVARLQLSGTGHWVCCHVCALRCIKQLHLCAEATSSSNTLPNISSASRHLSSWLHLTGSHHSSGYRSALQVQPCLRLQQASCQPACRYFCAHCIARQAQQAQQPLCSNAALRHGMRPRLYHALLSTPATTAADAPSLASLQGLLHVYKQSLDNIGQDAVEQLRHTLAPSDTEELHDQDTGKHMLPKAHIIVCVCCQSFMLHQAEPFCWS